MCPLQTQTLARPERFELPTLWFVATRSIQLSYGRVFRGKLRFWRMHKAAHISTRPDPRSVKNSFPVRDLGGPANPGRSGNYQIAPFCHVPACGQERQRNLGFLIGGERGIRTLDGLLTHTPLAGARLRPLGHLSGSGHGPKPRSAG